MSDFGNIFVSSMILVLCLCTICSVCVSNIGNLSVLFAMSVSYL